MDLRRKTLSSKAFLKKVAALKASVALMELATSREIQDRYTKNNKKEIGGFGWGQVIVRSVSSQAKSMWQSYGGWWKPAQKKPVYNVPSENYVQSSNQNKL